MASLDSWATFEVRPVHQWLRSRVPRQRSIPITTFAFVWGADARKTGSLAPHLRRLARLAGLVVRGMSERLPNGDRDARGQPRFRPFSSRIINAVMLGQTSNPSWECFDLIEIAAAKRVARFRFQACLDEQAVRHGAQQR